MKTAVNARHGLPDGLERHPSENFAAATLAVSTQDEPFGTCNAACDTAEHLPVARFVGCPGRGHSRIGHGQDHLEETV